METKPLNFFYSRTAVTTDWKCQRSRYYGYEYAGRGLSPDTTILPLFLGTVLHDGLAAIAHGLDIDEICTEAVAQIKQTLIENATGIVDVAEYFANEQASLTEGLLRGYNKHVWPNFRKFYPEIVWIEKEMVYEHDGLTFLAKPDLIVRDTEGNLWYVEYKSTSSSKDQWINSWSTAVQLHSSVRAVEATLNEKVTGVIVQGLYKGYVSYEKQNSPFCYAYYKAGNPPFNPDIWAYEYKAGLKKYPTWQIEGGVKAWVDRMPSEVLATQFPQVPPIFINDHLIDAFFRQRAKREHEIKNAAMLIQDPAYAESAQARLDEVFPQNFEACNPGWGSGCSFRSICHGMSIDPLMAGFQLRRSHHEIEEKALNGE